MTLSYKWLQCFLKQEISTESLSNILTSIGLEVEQVETFKTIKSNLANCVVGEVIACEKHPNADKLKITKINIGNATELQIVCGAPNVENGQKVMVALAGAQLTTFDNEFISIKKSKIRGEESEGMLCAEFEIGLNYQSEGIKILDSKAVNGTPLADYFEHYEDTVFEIGLTPNRMDAMSHFGVARDVAAYLNYHQKNNLKIELPQTNFSPSTEQNPIKILVNNTQHCKRYCGIYLKNVRVENSPMWLQNYLQAIGVKCINNIVDITNYILHSYGQPLHAFDADKILNQQIVIDNLPKGSVFLALDGTERKLNATDLMICDGLKNPMCIAGIYGGLESGISNETKNIFLEAAVFDSVAIRKTSFHHQLRTDAAQRFEKGVDQSNTLDVLKIATTLIMEICGAQPIGNFIDHKSQAINKKVIKCSYDFINTLSGKNYIKQEVIIILKSLQFEIEETSNDEIEIKVPFHKLDIENSNDIVEEIMRIDGIDNIPVASHIMMSVSLDKNKKDFDKKESIANFLVSIGCYEIFTNSIISSKHFNDEANTNKVLLLNSLSENLNMLSHSTLHNGLDAIAFNIKRKQVNFKFFEFNKSYKIQQGEYVETPILSLWLTGKQQIKTWNASEKITDLYDLKGIVESLLQQFGINTWEYKELINAYLENGFAIFVDNILLCNFGYIKNDVCQKFDIQNAVLFLEFFWNDLLLLNSKRKVVFKNLPKSLNILRDLSIVIDSNIQFYEIKKSIKQQNISTLKECFLFDVFENEKLGINKKAFAINFEFLDESKTLTDIEIETTMQQIIKILENNHNAIIRK